MNPDRHHHDQAGRRINLPGMLVAIIVFGMTGAACAILIRLTIILAIWTTDPSPGRGVASDPPNAQAAASRPCWEHDQNG